METRKNLLLVLGEWWEARRAPVSATSVTSPGRRWAGLRWLGKHLMSNLVSVLLVLVLLSVFPGIAAPNQAPSATSVSTIPYQGRLADASGNPITDKQNMEFRIYDVPAGGTPLWTESWTAENSVNVSDGLFSVMLGSIETGLAEVVQGNNELYLGIAIDTDSEMVPRVQLGSVPFSMISLTVPDGSVTTEKIADGAVTQGKLGADISLEPPDGSITTVKIADGAVTQGKLGADVSLVPPDGSITTLKLANDAVTAAKIGANAVGSSEIVNGSVGYGDLASDVLPVQNAISTNTAEWTLPVCGGDYNTNSAYTQIPGLSVSVSGPGTFLIDFTGLGANENAGSSIYSTIFVDGVRTTAGAGTLIGGCRNSGNDSSGRPWCTLANSIAKDLGSGSHTIQARVYCSAGVAKVHSGWLRVVKLP